MEQLYQRYRTKSEWLLVYIHEAHPSDGWQVDANVEAGIELPEPTTEEERLAIATECVRNLKLTIPTVIDDMDNKVGTAYDAWPDRLYIVNTKGKIGYKGNKGPGGFDPEEMVQSLRKLCNT